MQIGAQDPQLAVSAFEPYAAEHGDGRPSVDRLGGGANDRQEGAARNRDRHSALQAKIRASSRSPAAEPTCARS